MSHNQTTAGLVLVRLLRWLDIEQPLNRFLKIEGNMQGTVSGGGFLFCRFLCCAALTLLLWFDVRLAFDAS